jgi:hypothetical protein
MTTEMLLTVEMKVALEFCRYLQKVATLKEASSVAALARRVMRVLREQRAPGEQLNKVAGEKFPAARWYPCGRQNDPAVIGAQVADRGA